MTDQTVISFVIPCRNHGRYIGDAIASVEKCNEYPRELIIVDDGSTDEHTADVMSELKNSNYHVIQQENKGPGAARNTGITAAVGQYIVPVDSDNKIRADFVARAAGILDAGPEIGVVHSDFQYFGLTDSFCKIPPFDIKKMLYRNYIDTCAMFRKALWADVGGFDENPSLFGIEDWDFWLNAYFHEWKFLHSEMVGFDYADRPDSQLKKTLLEENWKKAEKYLYSKHAVLLREHYGDYHRWDYHGGELRRQPGRTLFRLFANAFFPKLHRRIYRID